jgi:hypothetical protein
MTQEVAKAETLMKVTEHLLLHKPMMSLTMTATTVLYCTVRLVVVFFDFLQETMTLELLGCYLFLTREFVKTSKLLRQYFRSTLIVLSKVLSKYFESTFEVLWQFL